VGSRSRLARAALIILGATACSSSAHTNSGEPDSGSDVGAGSGGGVGASSGGGSSGGSGSSSGSGSGGGSGSGTSSGSGSGSSGGSTSSTGSGSGSGSGSSSGSGGDASLGAGLHVVGNHFVDNGATVRLLGVDHSGSEYACVNGDNTIFEGPTDESLVMPMKAWNINAVRVPLNEDCWLGINGVSASLSGSAYQSAISAFVQMLRSNGMYVILDLHWNAPGTTVAKGQLEMPDEDHAPAFWESVATAFKSQAGVIFDLYNEPYPDNNQDTTAAWTCWRDGGSCPSVSFPVAGMQSLVTSVRSTGATNVILLGGVQYANALSQWLTYEPNDPLSNLAASTHIYHGQVCSSVSCFNSTLAPVAAKVPLITGELGESDCAETFVDSYFAWADPLGVSYLGWSWNVQDCSGFPALITDYSGTPTAFGQGFKTHLPTQ
jgi:endoglucanase